MLLRRKPRPAPAFRQRLVWTPAPLEPRQMLAADAGVATAAASDAGGERAAIVAETAVASVSSPHLVIIDSAIQSVDAWSDSLPDNAEMILLSPDTDGLDQITSLLQQRRDVASIHLVTHGESGQIQLGQTTLDQNILEQRAETLRQWKRSLRQGADLVLYGCDVASGQRGVAFVDQWQRLLDIDVAASVDRTGSDRLGADYDLEYVVGHVETVAILDHRVLQRADEVLQIEIWAAGSTGDELMELEINGRVVDTWFVRDTNAENGQFLPYYFDASGISADDIRINYVNDLYDPGAGTDRNLRIDRIVVDGVTYQAENSAVTTSGTFVNGQIAGPGNFRSEYVHANGYFQFNSRGADGGGGPSGSRIEIQAQGDTGDESMQLLIDNNVVATYTSISRGGNTYVFEADQFVSADRVRVAFINSVYAPGENYDQNLRVDRILIDGQSFESEAPSTFVSGTYIEGRGISSGNLQTETLHTDGYFQYSSGGTSGPPGGGNAGSFSLVTSEVTTVEGQGQITFEVQRVGGSSGPASVQIFTASDSAQPGSDYIEKSQRLNFANGETTKLFTVDVLNDAAAESTEQFSVRLTDPVGADLLAPRTSIVTILDDDSGLPRFNGFQSANNLAFNGSASIVNNQLQLTSTGRRQAGTAYFESAIPVDGSTSFQSEFAFEIGGGSGAAYADGMTFLIQNSSRGTGALGGAGGALGYSGIENSIAIEFDNYNNGGDIGANTIAVVLNGDTRNAIAEVTAPVDLNDGNRYYAWVDYNGDSNNLAVYISRTSEKPVLAVLKTNIDLNQIVGPSAYVGFSAGNFDFPNSHRIASWNFSLDVPPADPPLNPTGNVTARDIYSGLDQPLALDWSPDGRNIYIAEKAGVIKVGRDGSTNLRTVLDISDQVNNVQDRGLIDLALHPDFQSNGYIYLTYTYDPPEVFNHVGNANAGPDGRGNRTARLVRYQLDAATGFTTVVSGSERVLLGAAGTWDNFNAFVDSTVNLSEPQAGYDPQTGYVRDFINSDSRSHTIGALAFAPDGSLFVSTGDGASFNATDPRALRVQSLFSLNGKVLRIDPETGQGLSDNPFYDGDPNSNTSKIYQLGLRNPWRLTVDDATGRLFIGETGLARFEEINTGDAGANFGWPYYEGGQGVNRRTPQYENLPQSQAFYRNGSAVPATIGLAHQAGSNVVVLGDIVQNIDLGLKYEGDLFYNDLYRGVIRHANVGPNGELTGVETFATGAQFVVDIQQGADGSLYYANLLNGTVGRWELA